MAAGQVRAQVDEDMTAAGLVDGQLAEDLDARDRQIEEGLSNSGAFASHNLMKDWHARMHGQIATEAFDEIQPQLAPALEETLSGTASLTLDPNLKRPDYWDGVDFHRTAGGWDGHPFMGFIHGEIIHKKMVARFFPGGIFKQRLAVAEMAPRDTYERILDMGCSSGHFTTALAKTYPDAKITGVDLSARMLEHALRTANTHGWNWDLYQCPAEQTGFDANSFDLISSYILLHELPEEAVIAVLAEAYRVLEPGGDMIMSDVTRYADLDQISVWKADRAASLGGEPHWRASASLDLRALAHDAGFVDVAARGVYPHILTGSKAA